MGGARGSAHMKVFGKQRCFLSHKYCDVFPLNTLNNLWVADFISQFIGYTPRGITITHNTSNLISHKPVTSSGFCLELA
jgi:hypothetical protein